MRDMQHPRNQPPPPVHLRDFSNHPMDAIIPTSSNTNPSTASDVRSRPISTNLSRCSEHVLGPYLKDKFTPRKSSRNAKRQNMVIDIDGYKKWVIRKCRKQTTHGNNLRILRQGREDNPLHTDAFNELIENLKERNPTWNTTTVNNENSVTRTLFMEENRIVMEITKNDI